MDFRMMQTEYVRKFEGVWRIGGMGVSLDSLAYLFREGMSAESRPNAALP
jgi:hypothetical protein